jgi:hypothetical protein
VWGVWGCGGCGGVGGVRVWGHSLRSTFHRLHLLRLWTPTILKLSTYNERRLLLAASTECSAGSNDHFVVGAGGGVFHL